ncbi:unnamed protein product, partial [Ixodes hexagonus]
QLKSWAIESGVSQVAFDRLLKLLGSHPCFSAVPKCARTVLKTPRVAADVQSMGAGKYCHFGLAVGLQHALTHLDETPDHLLININIDGLPLSKSTKDQFWPVLCQVINCGPSAPFPIGVYYGKAKLVCVNTFLQPFVADTNQVLSEGVLLKGKLVPVKLAAIVCDAPARAYILGVKGHNGYFGCTRCTTEGDFVRGRMCFPQLDAEPRTDQSFRSTSQEEHHVRSTVLKDLPIDLVQQLPLDYMHLVCLGAVRKLILLWCRGDYRYRLGSSSINELSLRHVELEPSICSDFSRRPRTLRDVDTWKATEFRTFLLYTGPIVLRSILPKPLMENFMVLHCAITILSSPTYSMEYIDYAEKLLLHFVEVYMSLYGKHAVSYNIHNLVHLASDVRNHGILQKWSAFPFENFMGSLKGLLRKPGKKLEQLHNRIMEARNAKLPKVNSSTDATSLSLDHDSGPLPGSCCGPQYKKLVIANKFTLRTQKKDNTVVLVDGSIVQAENFAFCSTSKEAVLIGRKFQPITDLYAHPCPSSMLGIYLVSDLSPLSSWPLSAISQKCVRIPIDTKFAVLPLVHLH